MNRNTDVYLTVNAIAPDCAPPTVAQHVQLKTFDPLGDLKWTKNAASLALTSAGASSVGALRYSDILRDQHLKSAVEVKSCQGGALLVLRAETGVQLRPDLAPQPFSAPPAYLGSIVNLVVPVRELNGDLGATANVYLWEDENLLDLVEGISLSPFGSADAIFSLVFNTAGTHHLTVVVGDVQPGDYDLSNNALDFDVEVSQAPAYYYASYSNVERDYFREWKLPWDYYIEGRESWQGRDEYLTAEIDPPTSLRFPIDRLRLQISADGSLRQDFALTDLAADSEYDGGCYYSGQLWRPLGDGVDLYIYSYRDACSGYTYEYSYAYFSRYAGDYVYSYNHTFYWGDQEEGEETGQIGELLNATSSIDIRLVLEDDGAAYGGSFAIPLLSYPFGYSWDWADAESDAFDRGHDQGMQTYGYSSGQVVP